MIMDKNTDGGSENDATRHAEVNIQNRTLRHTVASIKSMFPCGSKSFIEVNAPLSLPQSEDKTPVQPIVATPRRGRMNKVEAEYAMILEAMKRKGEILRYEFEGITLRWFDMRYTPDFVVLYPVRTTSSIEGADLLIPRLRFIEVKGAHIHYSQQAMARFKGARGFWPEFTFELHQKTKEGWKQLI